MARVVPGYLDAVNDFPTTPAPDIGDEGSVALSQYFVGDATTGETLTRVVEMALTAVPVGIFAGITMTVDARVGTYVFTHPEVAAIEQGQYDTGDGPSVLAFRTGGVVVVESTDEEDRFPRFCAVAREYGIGSVVSLPMRAREQVVGVLNLYAPIAGAFGEAEVKIGMAFATQAAFLFVNAKAYWDARTLSENLADALASRAAIEQAKGMLMATTGVGPDAAFDRLRAQSQYEKINLREPAALVRRTRRPQPLGTNDLRWRSRRWYSTDSDG